jgi:hypothetical protein
MTEPIDIEVAELAFLMGDSAALGKELQARFPEDPWASRAEDLARLALGTSVAGLALSAEAQVFFANIAETRRLLMSGKARHARPRIEIGRDMDFIANLEGVEGWTIPHFLNYLSMRRLQPTRQAAVVATMRDDGLYVLEWIAHYRALGFEHIFIYTNDNADGSDELLRLLAGHGIITLIESTTDGKVPPEVKAYEHSLQMLHELRDFKWVLYMDSDEFFILAPRYGNSIASLLAGVRAAFPQREPSAICYQWRWYVSGMAFAKEPGILIDRFQHARPHSLTKVLVRLSDIVSVRHQHYADVIAGGFQVDSAFREVADPETMWSEPPTYESGWINHYWPKSFEEFAIKKARGQTLVLEENTYDRPFHLFFNWNDYEIAGNHVPVDPVLCAQVRAGVEDLRRLAGVAAVADAIESRFPQLLEHYYGDRSCLRLLYEEHKNEPSQL